MSIMAPPFQSFLDELNQEGLCRHIPPFLVNLEAVTGFLMALTTLGLHLN